MRSTLLIFFAVFFQYSCGNAINPVLAPLAIQTGMTAVQTGLFFTLSSLMWLAASPYWGRQSETMGRKRVMLIGLGSCSALYMLFAVLGGWGVAGRPSPLLLFVLLLLIRIASGMFFSTVPVAAQAYVADTTEGGDRAAAMTMVWMASGLGSIAGPSLGVFSKYDLMAPLFIGSLLPLLGFLLVWAYLAPSKAAVRPAERAAVKIHPFDGRILRFLFIIASLQASVLAIQVTTGFFIEGALHFSPGETAQTAGLLFMLAGAVSVASQVFFVRILKLSPGVLLKMGAPVVLLSSLGLFFHDHITAVYLSFALLGLGTGLVLPGATASASLSADAAGQGIVAGRISAAQGLGTALGPLFGTALYHFGSVYPYILTGSLFLTASILAWTKWRPGV